MNALAIVLRTALLLLALALVVRKAWPGELLDTPLAQLTLGGLLWALVSVAIGFVVGGTLVAWTISIPQKDKRGYEWAGRWVMTTVFLALLVAFPFLYEGGQKRNAVMDVLSAAVLNTIGWLIS
jgi:uncharacterized membrane protein (DUF485 family)